MTSQLAKDIITGRLPDCSKTYTRKAWQHLVDTGEVWQMHHDVINLATALLAAGLIDRNAP
jgi:hypothetical protein